MTYGSRLSERQQTKTITVYQRSSAGVETAVSAALTAITVTYQDKAAVEAIGEFGAVHSVFEREYWFYPISGALPAITEQHFIRESGDTVTNYEVKSAIDQGGAGEVLLVKTERRRL